MEKGSKRLQVIAALTASLTYVSNGAVSGWNAPVIPKLESGDEQVTITEDQGSWLASIPGLPGIAILFVMPFFFDSLGRKTLLLLTAVPHVVGFAWEIFATSYWELMVSRIVINLSSPLIVVVIPVYLVEIAEDEIRGTLITVYQLMMNLGILLLAAIGPYLSLATLSGVLISFPALFVVTFIWMPESPYYYFKKGRYEDATKSLRRLRGVSEPKSAEAELEKIRHTLEQQRDEQGGIRDLFLHPGNRRTLIIMAGFTILCNLTGIQTILAYANDIFDRSGASLDPNVSAIILAAVQLAASVLAPLLVDRVGRRPLLLMSFAGCAVSLFAEGVYFYLMDVVGTDVSNLGWLPLTALIVFLVAFNPGVGCLLWTVCGELFASNVKGLATSLLAALYALLTTGFIKLFQVAADSVGIYVMFWIFGGCCAIGVAYTIFLIPETRNKSLMEINDEMNFMAGMKEVAESHEKLQEISTVRIDT